MYKQVEVKGKGGISAKIVLDSVSAVTGDRMVTYEVECHRYIWAEMLTHKMLSRNAASSRAIPVTKMFDQCNAAPIYWGKNQGGMQAWEELPETMKNGAAWQWEIARKHAIFYAESLLETGLHKQHANRLTEPFQMMKAVVSATEWDNFFWLRNHEAAQPEIAELARCMLEARMQSVPQMLACGEWHLPYVTEDEQHLPIEDKLKISTARCAAVSFRNTDYGLDKSREVWERLVGDDRKHSSAMEHQAKVMHPIHECKLNDPTYPETWEDGISHVTRDGSLWSGNLKGFIQLRKLIDGECCTNYFDKI